MQLWDTAGQERFQSLSVAFYRGADALLLVCDLSALNENIIQDLESERDYFMNTCSPYEPEFFPVVVAGNKVDLRNQSGPTELEQRVIGWCDGYGYPYFATSAKTGENVTALFQAMLERNIENYCADPSHDDGMFISDHVALASPSRPSCGC